MLARNFKAFLTNLDVSDKFSVSDNSPSVIDDSVSSIDISITKKQRLDNESNTIIGHLNINSIRNNRGYNKTVWCVLSFWIKTKQFRINGYKIFRLDRNRFGSGLIQCVNENIPCKPLQEHIHLPNFEVTAIEFYQNNQKWLLLR